MSTSSAASPNNTAPGGHATSSANAPNASLPRLGPAWYRGGGHGHGHRGYPPPPCASTTSGTERSAGEDGKHHNINAFSALGNDASDEEGHRESSGGGHPRAGGEESSGGGGVSIRRGGGSAHQSRSEALLGSHRGDRPVMYNRSGSGSGSGSFGKGRSLSELAARVGPSSGGGGLGGRSQSGGYRDHRISSTTSHSIDEGGVDKKPVIRYTRERLLSLRPQPDRTSGHPSNLKHLEGTVVLSASGPQDPVCFNDFDADEIWSQPPSRTSRLGGMVSAGTGKPTVPGRNEPSTGTDVRQNGGRWQRGVVLPPPGSTDRRRDEEATNPDDLWDDPVVVAGSDLSQFAGPLMDETRSRGNSTSSADKVAPAPTSTLFDWNDISEATSRFEKDFHQTNRRTPSISSDDDKGKDKDSSSSSPPAIMPTPVDPHKPLASDGTAIYSGSGDEVNVFEDFAPPSEPTTPPTTEDTASSTQNQPSPKPESPEDEISASSRLMQMIGIVAPPTSVTNDDAVNKLISPWGSSAPLNDGKSDPTSVSSFPPIGGFISSSSAVPKNPWGAPAAISQPESTQQEGLDLASRLGAAVAEKQAREAAAAAAAAEQQRQQLESEKQRAQQQQQELLLRRQKEEEEAEAQRIQAMLRAQIEAQAAAAQQAQQAQQARQAAEAQRQAAAAQAAAAAGRVQYNSQVEAILLERISSVLENSWGRSDLMAILSTLHMEDSRVIPLLGSIDALKALLSRHPQRIALTKEPNYGVDVAILIMTNAQWQQNKMQQEELQRQQQMQAAQAAAAAQAEAKAKAAAMAAQQQQEQQQKQQQEQQQKQQQQQQSLRILNAPWFYTDPQGNIQGPFGGEEMRQWLDAGYFKGDLPISQNPNGPFRTLSSIFPDPAIAFQPPSSEDDDSAARAAAEAAEAAAVAAKKAQEEERARIEAENAAKLEEEKKAAEAAAAAAAAAEKKLREAEAAAAAASSRAPTLTPSSDQNASSVQLKMLLGLGGGNDSAPTRSSSSSSPMSPLFKETKLEIANQSNNANVVIAGPPPPPKEFLTNKEPEPATFVIPSPDHEHLQEKPQKQKQQQEKQQQQKFSRSAPAPSSSSSSKLQPQAVKTRREKETVPPSAPSPAPPAPTAWGGAAAQKSGRKKSMSEIQQEEARVAALLAKERKIAASSSRSGTGGWANIAASGGGPTGWSSGAVKQTPQVVVLTPAAAASGARSAVTSKQSKQQMVQPQSSQPQLHRTASSSSAQQSSQKNSGVDDFGVGDKMSSALENWCKDQMRKLTGSDDLTLISFCMTLSDPIEIRQYLTAYLGSSAQVNSFASEFINRKTGGKSKQEEWESADKTKKSRKKKTASTSSK